MSSRSLTHFFSSFFFSFFFTCLLLFFSPLSFILLISYPPFIFFCFVFTVEGCGLDTSHLDHLARRTTLVGDNGMHADSNYE